MFTIGLSRIELITLFGSVLFLGLILECVRRQRLKEAYSLLWLFTGIAFVILSTWHESLRILSDILGIQYAPATLFLLLMIGIFCILIQFSIVLSKRVEHIKNLNQEIALLNHRVEKLEAQLREREHHAPDNHEPQDHS
ncbi:MAG: DUF2304 domain-containing protein [Victivallales bacterium]|nr:DUF2304 domain-containing protein [Victivallales bacterium]